jgi:hypothetical protein
LFTSIVAWVKNYLGLLSRLDTFDERYANSASDDLKRGVYTEEAAVSEPYALYNKALDNWREDGRRFPHCDPNVLHSPGLCSVCDDAPGLQLARKAFGISFTGQYESGKAICPAQVKRPLNHIEMWYGNRAQ